MKIVILSTAYPLRGGIAHYTGLLYKTLSRDHNVKVITFKRQYPSIFFPGKSQHEGDEVERIPTEILLDSINPFNWLKVGNMIRREKPELLIFKFWMPFFAPAFGTVARIARKNGITKVLVICDNVIPHERKPGDVALTKYFFRKADFFVTMSDSVTKDLLKIKRDAKFKLLFHPVYSNFGNAVDKKEALARLGIEADKTLLFFGFIRDYKGLDVLLEAVAILKNKIDFKLIVAGEFYVDRSKYIDLIERLGIEKFVILREDFIPTSEVKYYFSAADAVVLPYKNATQSGIVQIANNFLKPVIATNVGGLGEIIKNGYNGYITEPNNPRALAEAILEFFEEKDKIDFVSNIKKELGKYSWEKFAEEIIDLVESNK